MYKARSTHATIWRVLFIENNQGIEKFLNINWINFKHKKTYYPYTYEGIKNKKWYMHVCIEILWIVFKFMYVYLIKFEFCFYTMQWETVNTKTNATLKRLVMLKTTMYSQKTTVNIIKIDLQRKEEMLDLLISLIMS